PGAHTGTFRGNQLAFASGAEAVRIVRRDGILQHVQDRGTQIESLLKPLEELPWVREVRGRGMMWGIELEDPLTGRPAGDLALQVQEEVLQKGLILETGGRGGCVVRLLPPLNTSAEVVGTACGILVETISGLLPVPDQPQ
ncbi:aminotransferase class III-fold pyridoxal phosphate-dependent enzyme, partial [Arthrobacter deserti]|nr:aminotransferase class III-fold pyridoxal phosphate-dependent enzyme [Arthrobacter deserti]